VGIETNLILIAPLPTRETIDKLEEEEEEEDDER
jgi:hypothetical protein